MSHQSVPPDVIYIIRHGEKPEEPAPTRPAPVHRGVDFRGNQNEHSLLPRGKTAQHRTHQTIMGISDRLGIAIAAEFAKGHEPHLAAALAKSGPGAVLICWDHAHIPALASALPLVPGTVIPKTWPDDRFDVIWAFTLVTSDEYSFAQVPQLLLSGDTESPVTPLPSEPAKSLWNALCRQAATQGAWQSLRRDPSRRSPTRAAG
jgi:hypothetical protein